MFDYLKNDEQNLHSTLGGSFNCVLKGSYSVAAPTTGSAEFGCFSRRLPRGGECVDIREILQEMIVLLRSEASRYSTSFRTSVATHLPQVMAHRLQLQRALMSSTINMINAIFATKEVDGRRELTVNSRQPKNERLLILVTDTRGGLPPQQADHIFNAFFFTRAHGTCLGLAISRSIVESHGGRLWARENSPRGTSFYLTLPITAEARQ
jgi:C4-dicarboxylate-specific signal transduction histidine kinase